MVNKGFYYIIIFIWLASSCVSTHKFKNNIPFYKLKGRDTEGFDKNGYYLSTIEIDANNFVYYKPYFLDEQGLVLSYGISDTIFEHFENSLINEINNSSRDKISAWGAYFVEKDTFRMQVISYNSKYNLFVRIPLIEHIFHINGKELEYVYSIDVNLPKPQRFEVKDFNLEFIEFPLKPKIEELID